MDVVNLTCDTLAILHGSSLLAVQVVNFNHIFWLAAGLCCIYWVFAGKSLSNHHFVFLVVFGWGLLVKSTSNQHSMRVLADFCGVSIVSIPKAQRIRLTSRSRSSCTPWWSSPPAPAPSPPCAWMAKWCPGAIFWRVGERARRPRVWWKWWVPWSRSWRMSRERSSLGWLVHFMEIWFNMI